MDWEYDKSSANVEYYEILADLMEQWEKGVVEFKEAKCDYNPDRAGRYFSAISNEVLMA